MKLLTVGRLHPDKGIDVLLEAMPEVLRAFPDTELDVVGDGPIRHTLEDKARQIGMNGNLRFRGFVSDGAELQRYYQGAEVYVQPSVNDDQPYSVMDAMSYGTPVVATSVGGVPDLIEDGVSGRLVPQKNPSALAQAIIEMLREQDRRKQYALAAHERLRTGFSSSNNVQGLLHLYRAARPTIANLRVLYIPEHTNRMVTRWRAGWPSRWLGDYGIETRIHGASDHPKEKMVDSLRADIAWADIVVFQKNRDEAKDPFNYAKGQGKIVGYDIDDLIFGAPDQINQINPLVPAHQNLAVVDYLKRADFVTASTSRLAREARRYNSNVSVLQNRVDLESLSDMPICQYGDKLSVSQANGINGTNQVRIVWAGTANHAKEVLDYFFPIFQNLVKAYGSRVKFIVKTNENDRRAKSAINTYRRTFSGDNFFVYGYTPENEWKQYYKDLAGMQPDIMINALPNTRFNSCKSALKFLESSLLGVPLVTTSGNDNGDVITDGYNGYTASSQDEFHAKVKYLVDNWIARRRVGMTSRWTLEDSFSTRQSSMEMQNILRAEYARRFPGAISSHLESSSYSINWNDNSSPDISVLMRTANRPVLLERAIKSALAQEGNVPSYEIVVVNNGEEFEQTREVIRRINSPRVRYIEHTKRHHIADAINQAILGANGKYLTYLDDDDVLMPNHIAVLYKALKDEEKNSSKVGLVYSDVDVDFYRNGKVVRSETWRRPEFDRDALVRANYIISSTCMHRKSLYSEVGYSDPDKPNCDDWDRLIRMSRVTDFKRVPVVTKRYTVHREGQNDENWIEKHRARALAITERIRSDYARLYNVRLS